MGRLVSTISFTLALIGFFSPITQAQNSIIDSRVFAQLESSSTVRVIINLQDLNGNPISPTARNQEDSIRQAQEIVLSEIPEVDLQLIYQYDSVAALAATVTRQALAQLESLPEVMSVQIDEPMEAFLVESLNATKVDVVHSDYGLTGRNVTVAILDTGIDTDHPDFAGKIVAQHCFNAKISLFGIPSL